MKLYFLLAVLCPHLHLITAEFYKECVPACGEAFLVTKDNPKYYEKQVAETYDANENKSSKIVYQKIKGVLMPDQKKLGKNALYFEYCTSVKGDMETKKGLEKYGQCRLILTPEMTLVASRELAHGIPDTSKGLRAACSALKEKFKNDDKVEMFEKCIKIKL